MGHMLALLNHVQMGMLQFTKFKIKTPKLVFFEFIVNLVEEELHEEINSLYV